MRKPVLLILGALLLAQADDRNVCRAADGPAPRVYTRVATPDSNTVQLQIALRKFVPAQNGGPAIWLAGVMHVGDPEYYRALQQFLDAQTVVLYEGINAPAHPRHVDDAAAAKEAKPTPPPTGTNEDYSMQSALARSLGLVFQLEAIDYDRTNFLNSDLSISQIQRIMAGGTRPAAPGEEGPANASFDVLLKIMDGSSFLGSLFKAGLGVIASSPELRGMARLTMIEAVGRLKGDLTDIQGLPPDWKHLVQVLIEARNEHLLSDLRTELKKIPPGGSVALFYGAGHMDDLEKRVTGELHYRPAEEKWMTAFSVDLDKSGISPFAAGWLRSFVQEEMEQIQRP
jgi:hypothetical protein